MNLKVHNILLTFGYLLLLLAVGCKKRTPPISPLSGGFGIAATWIGIDSGPAATLFYTDINSNTTMIWPFFGPSAEEICISNDIAFFSADLPDEKGRLGVGAYLAVQGQGPVLDVSKDLLKIWADSNRLDFETIKDKYKPLDEGSTNNGIHIHFTGPNNETKPDFIVTWEELSKIVQDVKKTGKRHITTPPATVYLRKDYDGVLTNGGGGFK